MRSIALVVTAVLACLGVGSAATVDVDYPKLRDTDLGRLLVDSISPQSEREGVAPLDLATACTRVLVSWEGPKGSPVVRYRGVPAQALIDRLAAQPDVTRLDGPVGASWPVRQKGFVAAKIADDEIVMATAKMMPTLVMPPWPERHESLIAFSGPATDLKLGDLQDELASFDFVWESTGKLLLLATANSKNDAKSVMRYISLRKPLLETAAAIGVEKAEFPAKLLDGASFSRSGEKITVKSELDDAMRSEAVAYLVKTIGKQMRRYNRDPRPAAPAQQ